MTVYEAMDQLNEVMIALEEQEQDMIDRGFDFFEIEDDLLSRFSIFMELRIRFSDE